MPGVPSTREVFKYSGTIRIRQSGKEEEGVGLRNNKLNLVGRYMEWKKGTQVHLSDIFCTGGGGVWRLNRERVSLDFGNM